MHLHGIMTDSAIRARCELPIAHVRFGVKYGMSTISEAREPIYYPNNPQDYASLDEYIKQEAERIVDRKRGMLGGHIIEARHGVEGRPEHTEPMIHPFTPRQVKEWERNATPDEEELARYLPKELFMRRLGKHVRDVRLDPVLGTQIREKIISYGLSSMGYDVRLADEFKIFTNVKNAIIDPLDVSNDCFVDHKGPYCIIPPNSYVLGHTIEFFDLPPDVIAICLGKSTYARAASIVNVTPIEPGFKGQVVIEISNSSPVPLKVYANQGIAQFMFFRAERACDVSYADRQGKYQGQTGITMARV